MPKRPQKTTLLCVKENTFTTLSSENFPRANTEDSPQGANQSYTKTSQITLYQNTAVSVPVLKLYQTDGKINYGEGLKQLTI